MAATAIIWTWDTPTDAGPAEKELDSGYVLLGSCMQQGRLAR